MRRLLLLLMICPSFGLWAQTHPLEAIVEAARGNPPALKELLATNFPNLKNQGTALVWGQDFLFVAETAKQPMVSIDGQPDAAMTRVPDSELWYTEVKMRTGVTHSYEFRAEGKTLFPRRDVAGYNPDSYPKPGVPKGTLSGKHTIASKIYDGSTGDYWVYVSPGVDPARPAPLMVWQDGQGLVNGDFSALRLFTVTENLVAQKLIPPMIHVMISPGTGPRMRSIQYDTVSDRFGRYLLEEVLPEVEKTYKLRADGYSRGIAGESSGAICALNVAWHFPEKFSRVHSTIGSYTALQWHPEEHLDGANVYPFLIRKESRKNIRIWQSDGMDDIENQFGSWPLQAVELANSLKMQSYDFHFRFGEAAHDSAQAALDLPESLAWLWRGYDAGKTEQTYEMDPAERGKPLYRVKIGNRDAW
ncbi:MAG TPA: alpha/beta hydrolase-fold protein [Bryobacteraceae bacterium]|jgi:enterochelin esterase family protein|nr:alpha/beta hydrolase-fold protein [Bryobacteraceae bacterium]